MVLADLTPIALMARSVRPATTEAGHPLDFGLRENLEGCKMNTSQENVAVSAAICRLKKSNRVILKATVAKPRGTEL